jgi:hypothetical protein
MIQAANLDGDNLMDFDDFFIVEFTRDDIGGKKYYNTDKRKPIAM